MKVSRLHPQKTSHRLHGITSAVYDILMCDFCMFLFQFGKGVYFADICSKSANYCFATRSKNVGLLLLCDVCLASSLFVDCWCD